MDTFQNIMRVEEEALKKSGRIHLSISEMHLVEAVGKAGDKGITVSEIAEKMNITRPSATIATRKLEQKGYLEKKTGETDGRMVFVTLTRKGQRVDRFHRLYHFNMVKKITESFDDAEKESLLKAVAKINQFFKGSVKKAHEF